MNLNHFELKKTALLFFDILNGYVPVTEPGKQQTQKPWIQNAVRLSQAARTAQLPVFLPRATIDRTMRPPRYFSLIRIIP